jgi:mono/diheme cytochrome c family protein
MKQQNMAFFIVFLSIVGFALLLASCTAHDTSPLSVERGRYLVTAGGCGDCHSPKVFTGSAPSPDPQKLLSGYPGDAKLPEIPRGIIGPGGWGAITTGDMTAWVGPWGVSFASNITPHPKTGIGNWSGTLFIQAIRNGKLMGTSRDMLPPMPWEAIGTLKDDDLEAIFAYLMSLPPVDNEVPPPLPPVEP